jgi:hypothetical protein
MAKLESTGSPVWLALLARLARMGRPASTARLALTGSPAPRWDPAAPRSRGADKRVDPALLLGDLDRPLAHPDALQALADLLGS